MPAQAPKAAARIAVVGLWHLGVVTAACLAAEDCHVIAVDPDPEVVGGLADDRPPVYEPGLEELLSEKRRNGWLEFALPSSDLLRTAELVWITFDTPVDDEDRADVDSVLEQAAAALAYAGPDALVVISSQLPVGSAATLQRRLAAAGRDDLRFATVPENLRLGRGIDTFSSPDRFVAGVRSERDREQLGAVLIRFTDQIEWMDVESAEMTKHALNAFLATSVAFINELASICERVGADASAVARGLKSDRRIGPGAYLSPGDAFAGGTLARDIAFLDELAGRERLPAHVVAGVAASNEAHRQWPQRKLQSLFADRDGGGLANRRIAIWGLTYKPGTDTLRRSSALALGVWLSAAGATVRAYDPAVRALPEGAHSAIQLAADPLEAVQQADALVVCTPWPQFRDVAVDSVLAAMAQPIVIDAGGHLSAALATREAVCYLRVGMPSR